MAPKARKASTAKASTTKASTTRKASTTGKAATARKAPTTRTAKSIRRADLEKLTQAAVRATTRRPSKIIREPIWGFVLDTEVGALETAAAVARGLSTGAREGGIIINAEPSVLLRKGKIIAGFIERDLNIPVRF